MLILPVSSENVRAPKGSGRSPRTPIPNLVGPVGVLHLALCLGEHVLVDVVGRGGIVMMRP